MAKIRPISDIHLEACSYRIHTSDDEANTILVIAGDLCLVDKKKILSDFFIENSARFKYIVYIAGNHEHWGSSLIRVPNKLRELIANLNLGNVFYLQNESVVLDGIAFIGATLWTDIRNPVIEMQIGQVMNDFRRIRTGTDADPYARKFRVFDATMEFHKSKQYIFDEITKQKQAGNKVYVVTHHAPSAKSICPKYQDDVANPAYYSDLDYEIEMAAPDVWQHGHVHWAFDYNIGSCRVICNPKGYEDMKHIEYTNYIPAKVIEV